MSATETPQPATEALQSANETPHDALTAMPSIETPQTAAETLQTATDALQSAVETLHDALSQHGLKTHPSIVAAARRAISTTVLQLSTLGEIELSAEAA